MPFDGVVTKYIASGLSDLLVGGRVEKIFQPEPDEIIIGVRSKGQNYKLLVSSSATFARMHLTKSNKENPMSPPMFCMLLRKHLSGGKILGIEATGYERLICMLVESSTELGDMTVKKLVVEIMGRYSNTILLTADDRIIDSMKHVDADVSSVREIMPARPYTPPPAQYKELPDNIVPDQFVLKLTQQPGIAIEKALLDCIKGFSPLICREICHRAGLDGKLRSSSLDHASAQRLEAALSDVLFEIRGGVSVPSVIYEDKNMQKPLDFHCIRIEQYPFVSVLPSISDALEEYYSGKDRTERLKQKKSDLARMLGTNLERVKKKLALQQEKLRDVADREKLKLFGELVTANIYSIAPGAQVLAALNYYSENGDFIDIPLDPGMTPQENAQRYYRQYSKAKSTFVNTTAQVEESSRELEYLESVVQSLDSCTLTAEIEEIRQELLEQGYLAKRRGSNPKKKEQPLPPLKFSSSDGFEILVGRNNRQNDVLTMKTAASNDLWLHTRNIPGSHVIVRSGKREVPPSTLLEAATLAAYHSRAGNSSNVPVDYTSVRNVKKPPGAKPGMVIYDNFKTINVNPDEEKVNKLKA